MGQYLNLPDPEFDQFFKGINQYVAQKCAGGDNAEWKHIPAVSRQDMKFAYLKWNAAYTKTLGEHRAADSVAKAKAKVDAKCIIRPFVYLYLREDHPEVSDVDRTAMGIPNRAKKPDPYLPPEVKPEIKAVIRRKGNHRITALNSQTRDKKKPPHAKGIIFACRVRESDSPVSTADDMSWTFQVHALKEFQYTEADHGKTVDYACAYENDGRVRGPWSEMISIRIAYWSKSEEPET